MRVLVLGGSGELGSNFSKICVDRGDEVTVVDMVRFLEAWRLQELNILDVVKYVWKSSFDLATEDVRGFDLILDCACQPDRPFGTTSPRYTLLDNSLGPLNLLEVVKRLKSKPLLLYPSSAVEFLGVPKEEQPITEYSIPKPTNVYGLTKWMAEELYLTYHRAFNVPVTIIRTASCYGSMMRTDQFIAKTIIKCLLGSAVAVKSPDATRTYTFTEDVLDFYKLFLSKFDCEPDCLVGLVMSNGGNLENKPYRTFEVAELIKAYTGSESVLVKAGYEDGELVNGKPVFQWETSVVSPKVLGWKPRFTLKDGLSVTVGWFRKWLENKNFQY